MYQFLVHFRYNLWDGVGDMDVSYTLSADQDKPANSDIERWENFVYDEFCETEKTMWLCMTGFFQLYKENVETHHNIFNRAIKKIREWVFK